jgi:hypothetical protein
MMSDCYGDARQNADGYTAGSHLQGVTVIYKKPTFVPRSILNNSPYTLRILKELGFARAGQYSSILTDQRRSEQNFN